MKISIVTYNLGGNQPSKANEIVMNFFDSKRNELPEVSVFGFQEMNGIFNINPEYNSNYQGPIILNACQGISKKFNLCLLVYVKKNIQYTQVLNDKLCTRLGYNKFKYYGSKGMQYIILQMNGSYYLFMNLHAPFATAKTTSGGTYKEFYNQFVKKTIVNFKRQYGENSPIFVMGDLNSRSWINFENRCINSIQQCLLNRGFNIKNAVVQDFGDDFPRQKIQSISQKKQGMTVQQLVFYNDLMQKLKKSDVLTKFLETQDLKDVDDITFLPSYKRDVRTGKFSLSKQEKLRLPGYADRILTTLDKDYYTPVQYEILKDEFTKGNITGSDHLPVYAIIEMNH